MTKPLGKKKFLFSLIAAFIIGLLPQPALWAQAQLVCDGSVQTVAASGVPADLMMPMDANVTQIELIAHGGDGGFANLANGCFSEGGAGANAAAIFNLGDEEGQIPYGSTIRFIVGIAGEKGTGGTVLGTGNTYGGGGGGTGILYKAPDSDEWKVLVVAGGGGGAYQGSIVGICVDSKTGQGGRSGFNGGDGNGANGGKGGLAGAGGLAGGLDGFEVSGGGGGAYAKAEGITCVDLNGSTEVAEGQQGFPNGGAGGGNEGCFGSTFRDGGFGFGGGASGSGGGGGGGGFSGGGGGGSAGRGGGGGSYIVAEAINPVITEGGLTTLTEDGFAQYRCIKRAEPEDEAPVAACVDSVVVISLNTDGLAAINPGLISSDTLNPALVYSVSTLEFSCDSLGERVLTLTVADSQDRSDSCTATIRIVDELAPELDCPPSVEVSCEADTSEDALGTVTINDNCGVSNLDVFESLVQGDCLPAQSISRVWTATDASGNTNSCEQLIVLSDKTSPVCTNCPEDVTVSCDAVPEAPALDVSDNCDATPTVELDIITTQTDTGCTAFSYVETRTWTITDACGNTTVHTQRVTVVDDAAPECLNCPADVTVSCDDVPEAPALEVSDNCDAAPTVELDITTTQTDAACTAFSYVETRTWTITDACGNAAVHTQRVTVVDDIAPECLNCPIDLTVSCDAVPEVPALEVSDNCDPAPAVAVAIISTQADDGSCGAYSYTETRTFTITDACGNSTEHVQVVSVEDTAAPALTCPPAITVTCDNDPALAGFPEVMDNCDPAPEIVYEDVVLSGDCDWDCLIERSWTATDACGNSSTCTQTIQQSVLELLEDALAEDLDADGLEDPLVIGRLGRHSLTVTLDGASCMLGWMPNEGGTAWPLVRKDFLVDGNDCTPDGLPIGANGKMNNPLVSETLILGIKLRLDPSAGEILLSDLDCDIHPIVFQGLPHHPTVADLYHQANLVVGNIIGLPFTSYYAETLACINGAYGLCPDDAGEALATPPVRPAGSTTLESQGLLQIKLYPNPVRTELSLDLGAYYGQSGRLLLFNTLGQQVLERRLAEIGSEPISLPVGGLSNGMYLLHLRIGDSLIMEQIVVQR